MVNRVKSRERKVVRDEGPRSKESAKERHFQPEERETIK